MSDHVPNARQTSILGVSAKMPVTMTLDHYSMRLDTGEGTLSYSFNVPGSGLVNQKHYCQLPPDLHLAVTQFLNDQLRSKYA